MSNDTTITIIGNLTAPPELRFTANGVPVTNFTVAASSRIFDKHTRQWRDADVVFIRCNVWRDAAHNVIESLRKGTRVIVSGRLRQRTFTTRENDRRTVTELEVDEVGVSLRYSVANPTRVERVGPTAPGGTTNQEQLAPESPDTGTDPFAADRHLAAVPELVTAGAGAAASDDDPPF